MDEYVRAIVQYFKDEEIDRQLATMGRDAFDYFMHHALYYVWSHIRDNIGYYYQTVMSFFGFGS